MSTQEERDAEFVCWRDDAVRTGGLPAPDAETPRDDEPRVLALWRELNVLAETNVQASEIVHAYRARTGVEAFTAGYQRGWLDGGSHGGEDAPSAEHLQADYREWLAHLEDEGQ